MKTHKVILVLLLAVPGLTYASSCKSPSKLHEEKMNKYSLPSFPSLLEDCGINDLLNKFGGDLFKSFSANLPDISACGYNTKDMASWFGYDSTSVGIDVNVNYGSKSPSELLNGSQNVFDANFDLSTTGNN